jgi:hypothetical protein
MNGLKRIVVIGNSILQKALTKSAVFGAKWFDYNLLSKEKTQAFLATYRIATYAANSLKLPPVNDAVDPM